ncbi:hypothetical protein LCGC14_2580940, partial [marine sediment metagenome]
VGKGLAANGFGPILFSLESNPVPVGLVTDGTYLRTLLDFTGVKRRVNIDQINFSGEFFKQRCHNVLVIAPDQAVIPSIILLVCTNKLFAFICPINISKDSVFTIDLCGVMQTLKPTNRAKLMLMININRDLLTTKPTPMCPAGWPAASF